MNTCNDKMILPTNISVDVYTFNENVTWIDSGAISGHLGYCQWRRYLRRLEGSTLLQYSLHNISLKFKGETEICESRKSCNFKYLHNSGSINALCLYVLLYNELIYTLQTYTWLICFCIFYHALVNCSISSVSYV